MEFAKLEGASWLVWVCWWMAGYGLQRSQCSAMKEANQTPNQQSQSKVAQFVFADSSLFEWNDNEMKTNAAEEEEDKQAVPQGGCPAAVSSHHQLQSIAGPHCAAIDGIDEWVRAPGRQANFIPSFNNIQELKFFHFCFIAEKWNKNDIITVSWWMKFSFWFVNWWMKQKQIDSSNPRRPSTALLFFSIFSS